MTLLPCIITTLLAMMLWWINRRYRYFASCSRESKDMESTLQEEGQYW